MANARPIMLVSGEIRELTDSDGLMVGSDVVITRGAANRLDLASGDSLNIVLGNLQIAGSTYLNSSGQYNQNLIFSSDNTLDIGASGATRPRTGYFGTSVVIGDTVTITGNTIVSTEDIALTGPGSAIFSNSTQGIVFKSDGGIFSLPENGTTASMGGGVWYETGKLSQAVAIFGRPDGTVGNVLSFYNKADESSPGASEAPVFGASNRINYNQGTISFWVKTSWAGDDGEGHRLFDSSYDTTNRVIIWKNTDNNFRCIINDIGVNYAVTSASWAANTWHWVAVRWNTRTAGDGDIEGSDFIELFLNSTAEVASSASAVAEATQVAQVSYIGCADSDGQYPLDGLIDDFAIWDRVLTDAELTTIYNSGTGATADNVSNGLITYFDFDGSGALAEDTNAGLGSQSSVTVRSTDADTTDVVVVKNGSDIFTDGDRFKLWDGTGYSVQGFINEGPTSTNIPIEQTDGGDDAVTGADQVGVYADLNGTTEYFSRVDNAGLSITGDMTISAWVKISSLASRNTIISKYLTTGNQRSYGFSIETDGELRLYISDDGTANTSGLSTNSSLTVDNKWHHVAMVYDTDGAGDNESVNFYLDGYVLTRDATATNGMKDNIFDSTADFEIGRFGAGGDFFAGGIRDVAIYNSALSATDILTLATTPLTKTGAPVSWWKLTDAAGQANPQDNEAAANHLTLVGGTVTNYGTHSRTQECFISKDLIGDGECENGGIGVVDNIVTATLEKDTSVIFKDAQSIKVTASGAAGGFNQEITVAAGEDYVFRGYHKSSAAGHRVRFFMYDQSNSAAIVTEDYQDNTSWAQWETCFEVPAGCTEIRANARVETSAEIGYFDSIQLLPNLVNNGGLEGGAGDPYIPTGWFNSGLEAGESDNGSGTVHSGDHCFHATVNAQYEGITSAAATVATGRHYEFAYWLRVVSGTARIAVYDGATNIVLLEKTNSDTGSSFIRFSQVFKAETTSATVYIISNVDGAAEFYVDDVSLVHRPDLDGEVVPDATNLSVGGDLRSIGNLLVQPLTNPTANTELIQVMDADSNVLFDVDLEGDTQIGKDSSSVITINSATTYLASGNLGLKTSTFGTNADGVIGILNAATVPATSPVNMIQIYSRDSSAGAANATLAMRTEEAVVTEGWTQSDTLRVWINGVEYKLGLDAV